jgi:uncharacterized DUF497 family protein
VAINWTSDKADHLARHGVTVAQANEAFYEPDAVVINPDYASQSGLGIRTVGFSVSFGDLISVLTWRDSAGQQQGATAFPARAKDRRYYEEA